MTPPRPCGYKNRRTPNLEMGSAISASHALHKSIAVQGNAGSKQLTFKHHFSIDGFSVFNNSSRDSISMSMVEEHICLKQEAARERIRKNQDAATSQPNFSCLDITSFLADSGCDSQLVYNTSSIDRKPALANCKC